ncbi:MAG: DNA-3-methyladenine glycosylase [Parcubacteria group bacterium]|nr:DNA-3-methyladenine glycosylase [Parcubacteria group bacterium]
MRKILKQEFFNRNASIVARDLLGKFLVRKMGRKEIVLMITETEAYDGSHDKASHAHKGKTARTEIMFGPAGHLYIYLCYGMYYMLNVVTGPKEYPAAVLIRAAKLWTSDVQSLDGAPIKDWRASLCDGPGKLTKFLKIDKKLNALRASPKAGLWFEDRGVKIKKRDIKKTPRVGVGYAGPVWSKKKMRFVLCC